MWFLVWTVIAVNGQDIFAVALGAPHASYEDCMVELHNAEIAVYTSNETLNCLESIHET